MISLILQLYGSFFLTWNAFFKNKRKRINQNKPSLKSMTIDHRKAVQMQLDRFLTVFGFSLIAIGYIFQLIELDKRVWGLFPMHLSVIGIIVLFLLLYGLIRLIANCSAKSFMLSFNEHTEPNETYLHLGEIGSSSDAPDIPK